MVLHRWRSGLRRRPSGRRVPRRGAHGDRRHRGVRRAATPPTIRGKRLMATFLEIWRPEATELLPLESGQFSIGRAEVNDVALLHDARLSRQHALLDRL